MSNFEELNDMAIIAVKKKGVEIFGEPGIKLLRTLKASENPEQDIIKLIIFLMFLADQHKINLEDALLNKIEEIHRL